MPWRTALQPIALLSAFSLSFVAVVRAKSQKARYYINLSLYVGSLLTTSFLALGVAVFLGLIGKRLNTNYFVGRLFYLMASPLTGVKLEVEGAEHLQGNDGPAIILGNHQSFMDILYLGKMFPKRASIMAKKELAWTPFLGWWMSLSGAVWIDRKRSKNALQVMAKAGDDMKRKGVSLFIFPEGTRTNSPSPQLLPFKKGAFHLAIDAGVPIIPVVCENYNRLFDGRSRMDGGVLRVKILPPIQTSSLTAEDVAKLAESTRESMLEALIALSSARAAATSTTDSEAEPLLNASADPARTSGESYGAATTTVEGESHRRDETAALDGEEGGAGASSS